jgi:hypothetical protein
VAEFDPRRIVLTLLDHGVDFVVIGASAALLQGVPLPTTLDFDVTAAVTSTNRKRLSAALADMDAKLRLREGDELLDAPLDERMLKDLSAVTLMTRFGPFEVLFEPSGAPAYADLRERSVAVRAYGVVVRVAALSDIIAMKRAAGREKDTAHLALLMDFLEEQEGSDS